MREISLTSKQIKVLTQRHKICREKKECDRIKAILLRNIGWSLAKISEALLIHEKSIKRYVDDYLDNDKLKPESVGSNSYLRD